VRATTGRDLQNYHHPQMTDPQRTSSGSDYADAMRDVLDRVAESNASEEAASTPKEPLLHRTPVVLTVFVTFVGVMVFNVWLARDPRRLASARSAEEATAQMSVMIASQVVDAYEQEHGEPPASLRDIGLPDGQYEYNVGPDGEYKLSVEVGNASVSYDSRTGPVGLLQQLVAPPEINR
jgi:hypothetical protein